MTHNGYHITIREMPSGERPRERLQNYGAGALSNTELLAILLRTGIKGENVLSLSTRLLTEHQGLLGIAKADFSELAARKGLGPAKTSQLKAALELGKRLSLAVPTQKPQITSPNSAANLLMLDMGGLAQEHLRVLLLDTKNYVIGSPTIYIGNTAGINICAKEVFRPAVKANASAIILAHNHPSGDPTPSPEDVQMTRQIIEAGELLGIKVTDHIIIGQQRFISLKEIGAI